MLDTEIAGIKMKNPLMLASGICDLTKESMERCSGAGAIVTKSVGTEERKGYTNPIFYDTGCGVLNAVGLANPGIDEYVKELQGIQVDNIIGSIFGGDAEEFGYLAQKFAPHVVALEMNLSCPHAKKVGAEYPVEEISPAIEAVKRAGKPVFAKLGMENIIDRAQAAVDAGVHGIVAINTVRAMAISIEMGMPVLGNRIGGYSGAAIKPIGVRCVYELASNFDVPVIGVGGITRAEDIIEYMMAGASAVQLGTALYYRGETVFEELCRDLVAWLEKHGYGHIREVVGMALKR